MPFKYGKEKAGKNRRVTLAKELCESLKVQIAMVQSIYKQDKVNPNYKGVWLPYALARKYPSAANNAQWQLSFSFRPIKF